MRLQQYLLLGPMDRLPALLVPLPELRSMVVAWVATLQG